MDTTDEKPIWFRGRRGRLKPETLRLIWGVITAHPIWSYRQIAEEAGKSYSNVGLVVNHLRYRGYVEHAPREARANIVLVPLLTAVACPCGNIVATYDGEPTICLECREALYGNGNKAP